MHPDLDRWFTHALYAPEPAITAAEIARRSLIPTEPAADEDGREQRPHRKGASGLSRSEAAKRREALRKRERPPAERRKERERGRLCELHLRAVLADAPEPMTAREIFDSELGLPRDERAFSYVALTVRCTHMATKGELLFGRPRRRKTSEGSGNVATYRLPPAP